MQESPGSQLQKLAFLSGWACAWAPVGEAQDIPTRPALRKLATPWGDRQDRDKG